EGRVRHGKPRSSSGHDWRVGMAGLLALAVAGCAPHLPTADRAPTEAVAVTVVPVRQGAIAQMLTHAGNVQSEASVNVHPKATARIERLFVDVGSVVQAGDVIAELDRS